jgi:hypothetical protein
VENWGKLLGDSAAVTVMLDRLRHHGHIHHEMPEFRAAVLENQNRLA